MTRTGFAFSYPIRVRYHEIDGQKLVYHSIYLNYIDVAVTEYFRSLGIEILADPPEFDFALAKTTVEFRHPARLDDLLEVCVRPVGVGTKSFTMHYEIYRQSDDQLICIADTVYVSYDAHAGKAVEVPDKVRGYLQAFS